MGGRARRHTDLTLITIGPLTNLARALQLEPRLGSWLPRVVMMGGLVERHKVGWEAQFETNFNADPLAAEIVFGSDQFYEGLDDIEVAAWSIAAGIAKGGDWDWGSWCWRKQEPG